MGAVNIGQLQQLFPAFDINRDGQLDRPELAKASLNLIGQGDQASVTTGSLLATMVQGGVDRQGLFPDFNGSGGVSFNELAQLAAGNGNQGSIEAADFQAVFGNRFQAGGNSLDINGLQQLAVQNIPKFQGDGVTTAANSLLNTQPFPPLPPLTEPGAGIQGVFQQMMQLMVSMMTLMLSLFGQR